MSQTADFKYQSYNQKTKCSYQTAHCCCICKTPNKQSRRRLQYQLAPTIGESAPTDDNREAKKRAECERASSGWRRWRGGWGRQMRDGRRAAGSAYGAPRLLRWTRAVRTSSSSIVAARGVSTVRALVVVAARFSKRAQRARSASTRGVLSLVCQG